MFNLLVEKELSVREKIMDYIDISITDTNGNTKTLPGINKDYVSRRSGKYSTTCMLNVFGCVCVCVCVQ